MEKPKKTGIDRVNRIKEAHKDTMRDQISVTRCLNTLDDVESELTGEDRKQLGQVDISRLKLLTDIQFRKLAKKLPDLKAVEHTGSDDEPISHVFKWQQ